MDTWLNLWTTLLVGSLVGYYAVVLVVLPLGARDILRLFATLAERNAQSQRHGERKETDETGAGVAGR